MAALFPILTIFALLVQGQNVEGLDAPSWSSATATASQSTTNPTGGACGYNIINADEKYAAAISEALFNDGQSCGQCFKITCNNNTESGSKSCRKGSTVTVVATSFFPSARAMLSGTGTGTSELEKEHFHLSQSAWKKISLDESKVVAVQYQRVPCKKEGGVKFTINGQGYFMVVLISNVAGNGSIKSVSIKGSGTSWIVMARNHGANWHTNACLKDQSISFNVTLTNGQTMEFGDVVPANWSYGHTYSTSEQFN